MVASKIPFPDYEAEIIGWAASLYPDAHVTDELPTKYESLLPVIVIEDNGGASDGLTLYTVLSVSVFARDTAERSGRAIARAVATHLCSTMSVHPRRFGGIVADTVEVTSWPSRSKAQEPDERTACFEGEVSISLRR